MSASVSTLDALNRRTYARGHTVKHYRNASGWLEAGERAAIGQVEALVRGCPILDIGVGGGRTVPLMLDISRDYVGIDYTPRMIDASRARFPGIDLRCMDARSLAFADESFGLVTFSYNGIDSLSHEDRLTVLGEARRVLRRGGHFVFSSLNRDGPLCAPAHASDAPSGRSHRGNGTSSPHALAKRWLRAAAVATVGSWNHLQNRGLERVEHDRALVNIASHGYGLVAAFISAGAQASDLERAGFALEAIYASADGARLTPGQTCPGSDCLHYVARKTEKTGETPATAH